MTANHASTADADLVLRSRHEASAFGELYERYAVAIFRYHLRCTRDPDAAHDLTAETFAQAWLARARFRDQADGSAAPWLYGIARTMSEQEPYVRVKRHFPGHQGWYEH